MTKSIILSFAFILLFLTNFIFSDDVHMAQEQGRAQSMPYQKSEEEWKKALTPEQYHVLRQKGTERPNSGKYNLHFEKGKYLCAACGYELFDSGSKFESHCGWPSFDRGIENGHIKTAKDTSLGMIRTEIMCAQCGSHLGHIFDDGPTETGLRYCVNSLSLDFKKDEKEK